MAEGARTEEGPHRTALDVVYGKVDSTKPLLLTETDGMLVPLPHGLAHALRTFAQNHGIKPETAAREAIRAYVGDDR